ncbi:alpha/beta fold hydrolase [Lichenicoccus sp.]|uniref:alpha/beta fold hydrolase n=1 Tax=Lichenicoccus sp. TaxID=2781899 RepID=UPI003D12BD51
MSLTTMMERHAALMAQCPERVPMAEEEALKLPIEVERFGATGPLVLIIHGGVQGGIGGGPSTFAKQQALANLGWQVAIANRPGFGRSPSRGADNMQADALWIADMLGDGGNLIGHSWGGAEALLAAARRPDAVRSLVLVEPALQGLAMIDPVVQADPAQQATVMRMMEPLLTAHTPGDYARGFIRSLVGTVDSSTSRNIGDIDDEAATRLGCAILQARMAPPPVLQEAAKTVAKANVPVLVISGGWNPSIDAVAEIVARVTGGRHVVVTSPNHFPQLESSGEFNAVVDAFMRQDGDASAAAQ